MPNINIFLDLDNTIISAEETKNIENINLYPERYKFDKYTIIPRPHLEEFLNYLFKNFDVSIWTAASKSYALFIIKNIIIKNHTNRKIKVILFYENTKNILNKKLSSLWNIWHQHVFNELNTLIIDDLKDVYDANKNCYLIKPFYYHDFKEDKELLVLKKYLSERYFNTNSK